VAAASIIAACSRPDRLRQIAERFNIDAEAVLENVIFTRCYNSDSQMDLLSLLAAKFHEESGVYRVLVWPNREQKLW